MKVLMLGAGVAGVTAAWHFWRDGHEVTVLERNPGVALETSFANGGQDYREINPCCGMRPATPKGTPVLGGTRYSNLWLNSGHGALGFTLGLATGRVVADLVAGRSPAVPLEGFTLDER